MEKTVHIAVVPGVGYNHLFPILQFSKLLVQLHPYFHVTCFIPSLGSLPTDSKTILQTLPSNISCTFLPPENSNDLPQGIALALKLQLTLTHSLRSIHQAMKSLTLRTPFVALVVDSFAIEALNLAKEFNMLSYVYFPSSVTTLSSYFYTLKYDKETSCEYRDFPEPLKVPGCVLIHGPDLVDQAQDRSSHAHSYLNALKDSVLLTGFLLIAPSSTANAAYLSASDVDPLQFLPSGFLERTKEQGMVIPSWAPQIQILRRSSVGGFLTHCGWNSTLESVLHGVPLITWSLFAEQRKNAVLLSQGLKVGLRPKVNQNGIVEKVQIAELIKCLMEGEGGGKLR